MAQRAKLLPQRPAGIGLEDQVPLLRDTGEVVGREPDPVGVARLMALEELLALV